jgi:hypothetical protein
VASERDEIEQLRRAVEAAHERIAAVVGDLDAKVLETEPALGAWSSRDVAGHLADWQFETLDAAEHILGGPRPRFQPIKDRSGYNMMRVALRGTDSWDLTWRDFEAAYARALEFLDRLSPEQLGRIGPFPSGEIGSLRNLLKRELAGHLTTHADELDEWRLRRSGVRTDRERRIR